MDQSITTLALRTRSGPGEARVACTLELSRDFLDRYELGAELGCGAMGMVCRATDRAVGRAVAVKFLTLDGADELARFLREGRLLARIHHPHVVAVYDIELVSGRPYIVTELLEGGTLRARLRGEPVPVGEVVRIATESLAGLGALHAAGVVHRDVKPDNVLFTADGTPKIADLGIARDLASDDALTRTGALVGTPLYMAPEQVTERIGNAATDLWAMGTIVYEMLNGEPPFRGDRLADLLDAIARRPVPPPGDHVPPAFAAVVMKALAKRPEERYASAEELSAALVEARTPRRRTGRAGAVARRTGSAAATPVPERGRWGAVVGLAVVLFAAGIGGASIWIRPPAVTSPAVPATTQPVASASAIPAAVDDVADAALMNRLDGRHAARYRLLEDALSAAAVTPENVGELPQGPGLGTDLHYRLPRPLLEETVQDLREIQRWLHRVGRPPHPLRARASGLRYGLWAYLCNVRNMSAIDDGQILVDVPLPLETAQGQVAFEFFQEYLADVQRSVETPPSGEGLARGAVTLAAIQLDVCRACYGVVWMPKHRTLRDIKARGAQARLAELSAAPGERGLLAKLARLAWSRADQPMTMSHLSQNNRDARQVLEQDMLLPRGVHEQLLRDVFPPR